MHRHFAWPYLFLFIVVLLQAEGVTARPVSQRLYEEQIGRTCEEVSAAEIERLRCAQPGSNQNFENLNSIATHLVFKPIADREAATLECLLTETRQLRDNSEAQALAVQATCGNLTVLKDVLQNISQLQSWISTYTSVNNALMRPISVQEARQNRETLADLNIRLRLYKELEKTIRASDPLLGSNSVYEAISGRFQSGLVLSADTPERACEYLQTNARRLLDRDVSSLKEAHTVIREKMNSGDTWINDESFLRSLWRSGSRNAIWDGTRESSELSQSTFCRMEGRYGQGAETRDRLYNVLTIAGGGAATVLGRLAVTAAASARTSSAVTAARVALGLILVQLSFSVFVKQ